MTRAAGDPGRAGPAGDPSAPRRAGRPGPPRPASYDVTCTDGGEVRVAADGTSAMATSHAYVDDLPLSGAFGDVVPALCADLVDVAVAAYVADRLCRRRPRHVPGAGELWQRRMHLEVPVREPDRWSAEEVVGALGELLAYLTDDRWTFGFVPRRTGAARPSETQAALFREPPPTTATAALFSGGLDSLAGLVGRLRERPAESVVVFSGRTNRRIGAPQRDQLRAVMESFPGRVRPVGVRFGLEGRQRGAYDLEETSQRTRGLVFQVFGAVTARMAGLDRLDVFENGVGAVNLPYSGAQLGAQATRATHPRTLGLVSAFLSRVLGAPFTVGLPFAFRTKGELCGELRDAGLGRLARLSVSCDGYPQRRKGADQCGVCPSCVLRRQSLHHAGLLDADPGSLYVHDVYDSAAPDARARRFALRAMGGQVHRLRGALASERPWDALVARYPMLDEAADALASPADRADACAQLVALYGRYCEEWGRFAAATAGPRDDAPDGTPAHRYAGPRPPARPAAGPAPAGGGPRSGPRAQPVPGLWQGLAEAGEAA